MEYLENKMNIMIRFLKKSGLLSMDLIYRVYYMTIFGSKLYFRHKIEGYRSCAFCRHLSYDKAVKKYVCSFGKYEACSLLLPCILPDSTLMAGPSYIEEEEQVPWLFKVPCLNFDVLDSKNYYKNFISWNIDNSVTRLEALEGIQLGSCSGDIPCHICATVNKDTFTKCRYVAKANEMGKCGVIYDSLYEFYNPVRELSNVS